MTNLFQTWQSIGAFLMPCSFSYVANIYSFVTLFMNSSLLTVTYSGASSPHWIRTSYRKSIRYQSVWDYSELITPTLTYVISYKKYKKNMYLFKNVHPTLNYMINFFFQIEIRTSSVERYYAYLTWVSKVFFFYHNCM